MTKEEPKTRHLSRAELSRVLRDLNEKAPTPVPDEPKTTLWARAAPAAAERSREPVTELEVQVTRNRKVRSQSSESKVETNHVSTRRGAPPTVITRMGIGFLVAGCAWWVGLRPLPPANVSAKSPRVSAPLSSKPSVDMQPARVVSVSPTVDAKAPSPRAAVDLLLAGREREALDAYRALSLAQPTEPTFTTMVSQLERELANCDKEPGPCAR
jgi:hypothetical protein